MPTYQYICKQCKHEFQELQSMKEDPLVTCPECKTDNLARVMSASGLIFKGSGFYLTDYKNAPTKKPSPSGEKKDGTEKKSETSETSKSTESKESSKTSEETKDSAKPSEKKETKKDSGPSDKSSTSGGKKE